MTDKRFATKFSLQIDFINGIDFSVKSHVWHQGQRHGSEN